MDGDSITSTQAPVTDALAADGQNLEAADLAEDLLVEEVSIDGMCGVY